MKRRIVNSKTKKINIVIYSTIAIALFSLGIFIGNHFLSKSNTSKALEDCKNFCEFIPNTEFGYVANNHCYCIQHNQIFDSRANKTMTYTQIVDAGVITNVEIR